MSEKLVMLELFAVPDTFVSGLGSVEHIGGGCYRFTMFSEQDVDGQRELVVALRVVVSKESIPEAMHMAATATGSCACQNARTMTRN